MDIDSAKQLALTLKQDLTVEYAFLHDWRIEFDNAKRRAGVCRLKLRVIGLSIYHVRLNSDSVISDTILHELAHAIAYTLYGEVGHGFHWKNVARKIGATPKSTGKFNLPQAPWILVLFCPTFNQLEEVSQRFRRNKNIRYFALRGRPETKGCLYYISSNELNRYKEGLIAINQLNLIQ
ncbi:SprT-like domain-containing protein [Aliikangiella maris]|uniref:SprT-like domain-containing protein n=2 Tax=Aliikangiella maris TaxID=3162458 RepID=A0ABV3MRK0_9GAMM